MYIQYCIQGVGWDSTPPDRVYFTFFVCFNFAYGAQRGPMGGHPSNKGVPGELNGHLAAYA